MKPKVSLRIAAIVMFLHDIGHTMGVISWKQPNGPVPLSVSRPMIEQKFSFMGAISSMGQFYDGLGLISIAAMLMVVAILWIISGNWEENQRFSLNLLIPILIYFAIEVADELIYFFPFAAFFTFVAAIFTGLAIIKLKNISKVK